jgi:hypothetical protein
MKQARKRVRGENRREAEIACGRNEAGPWKPSRVWTRIRDVAMREETQAGGLVAERWLAGMETKEL